MSRALVEAWRRRGLVPKKSFGQNFLTDARIAKAIAALATTPEGGTVVEIGAGLGALTEPLLERAAKVVAVERDRDLVPILEEGLGGHASLSVLEADAKTVDYRALFDGVTRPRVIAGNLPFQITGPLLEITVGLADAIDLAVYMVQREVADRLAAAPGTSAYGALTVFVRAAFDVEKKMRVAPGAFFPRPNVESAVVTLAPHPRAVETERFREAVHAAFAQRRKTLRNAWAKLGPPDEIARRAARAGIDLERRGETLSVEELAVFAEA
jgi:16S rRNA (adenine1518-N6/adenine1519-N6)-dimethyltransferase